VLNLVSNAVKFTAKGSVTIRARLLEHQAAGMCMLRIEVVDTGPGIAPEKRNEVFARFSQLDRSYARRFGGTGLGLAISRRLAELMGGTVDFFSEPGVETTFWCETPLRVVKPEAASLNTATTSQMRQLKVLVVEDNTTNQLVMRRLLENMGHQVAVVANGAEAVESVMAGSYDLVLMDVSMPVMDGIEATRRIRALGAPENAIPIIAVTANAMQGDIDACLQAGMNHFLSKPIVRSKLEAALAAFALETAAAPLEPTLDEETRLPGDEGLTRLALLEADIGRDMMPSLLSACASDLVRILGDLRTAFEHGDFKHFGHAAHAIRGLAVMLGISGLASLAANAEAACRDALEPAFGATPADFEKRIARASADISAQMRAYDSVG
jgi:CheY-like chemotaxis protein